MSDKRNTAIDIAKTIGIALVVLGHVSGMGEGPWLLSARTFIYQFHVPLFFFLSGLVFSENEPWKIFLVKKIRRLYLPFVLWNFVFFAIFLIMHYLAGDKIFFPDIIKHGIKIVLGIATTPLGGATWFLICLFEALILYKIIVTVLHSVNPQVSILASCIISAIIGILGTYLSLPWGMGTTLVAMSFISFGHLTRKTGILDYHKSALQIPLFLAGIIIVFYISRINHPDMALQRYGCRPLFWLSALIGSFSSLLMCLWLSRFNELSFLGKWGQKTMWILIGHFTTFKLVSLLQINKYGALRGILFSHPCNYVHGIWAAAYFIAGFFLPLAISFLFEATNQRKNAPKAI